MTMIVYLSFLFLPLVLMILLKKRDDKEKLTLYISFALLFLFLAIRSRNSAVDMNAYEASYNSLKEVDFISVIKDFRLFHKGTITNMEWGYEFFNWILAAANLDFQFLLILQSAVCLFSALFMIRHNSTNVVLSFALLIGFGFLDYTYCILRQSMALAILIFALEAVKNRKPLIFLLLVYLASLFHISSLIFILAYPLSYLPINRIVTAIFIGLSILAVLLFPFVIQPILLKFVELSGSGAGYMNFSFEFKELPILILTIVAFLMVFMKKDAQFGNREKAFFWTFMLMLPIEAISMYTSIFSRFSTLTLFPFAAVAIPNILETNENKKLVRILEILIYLAAIAYYSFCLLKNSRGLYVVPYMTIFS